MKKLLFGLIATVMFGFVGSAQNYSKITQSQIETLERQYGTLVKQDLDKSVLAENESETDFGIVFFAQKERVCLLIIGDNGVKSFLTSKNFYFPDEAKKQLEQIIANTNQINPQNRIDWGKLWQAIKQIGDGIAQLIDAITQP